MKIQKIKKFFMKNIYIIFVFFFLGLTVLGASTSYLIMAQSGTELGSNNSLLSFTGTLGRESYYVNNENNSAVIRNYFTGYYYDSLFGFFKLDWSNNDYENVRIIGSTDKCVSGYGYKLGGKAYSEMSGFIDFYYDTTTFVYYCLNDRMLHGMAYSKYIGFQNFEGIDVSIINSLIDLTEIIYEDLFFNDTTDINTSVSGHETIGGDLNRIEDTKESIFYIVK